MTVHTGDLDHALTGALHAETPHADAIHFEVTSRAADGTPLGFRVAAWRGLNYWVAENTDRMMALDLAMSKLRAAIGGAA